MRFYVLKSLKQIEMKELTAILLIFISISLKSQDATSPDGDVQSGQFSIGVYFSPDAADMFLQNNNGKEITDSFIEDRNLSETMKFGFSTGFSLVKELSEKVSVRRITGKRWTN